MDSVEHYGIKYRKYQIPLPSVLATNRQEFMFMLQLFCEQFGYSINNFTVDEEELVRVFIRTDQRKVHYKMYRNNTEMNEQKVASTLAYWLVKYKPLTYFDEARGINLTGRYNELFAIYLTITTLKEEARVVKKKKFRRPSDRLIKDFYYALRHRHFSYDSIALFVDGLSELTV